MIHYIPYLKDIKLNNEFIHLWQFIQVDACRIYFKPNEDEGNGFWFWIGSFMSGNSLDEWDVSETKLECLYRGMAYFDGIRHLSMGDEQTDNYGYDYYANLKTHIRVLEKLRELEEKYCSQLD